MVGMGNSAYPDPKMVMLVMMVVVLGVWDWCCETLCCTLEKLTKCLAS